MFWRSRREREADMQRELDAWLEAAAEEQEQNGLNSEEARAAARRTFGNATRVKEEVREVWGWTRLGILIQDIGYALRTLRASPGFALTTFLTLALGIGASTAVFTVVDSVVLQPLAYRDSAALVAVWEHFSLLSPDPLGPNPRHADLWQRQATAFSGLALVQQSSAGLTLGTDHPRLLGTVVSSANLFDVLQVTPLLGRTFGPEDDIKGRDNVAILSYPLWQSVFQGDPHIVGTSVRLGKTRREVIGVLPAGFRFPNANALRASRSRQSVSGVPEPVIYVPAALDPNQFSWNGEYGNWVALARLRPGFSARQAEAQLNAIESQAVHAMSAKERGDQPFELTASIQPMQAAVIGDSKTRLWLLMAAVMSLMLIASLNLANAQLARSLSRRREAAVRTALGASRFRLLSSCLIENLILAVTGGAAGVFLASVALNLFRRYSPVDLPRLSEVGLNPSVLLFSMTLTLGSSILFGVGPAIRLMRADPQEALQQGSGRVQGMRQSHRLRGWLVGLQVFGCSVLLLLTALFSKNLLQLLRQDKGFEPAEVAVVEVRLSNSGRNPTLFADGALQALRQLPGVGSTGLISAMPLEGETWIEGVQRVDKRGAESLVNMRWASPGYFETLRERLVAGRFFEERDGKLNGAVLSESLAKALWPDEDPIGEQIAARGDKYTVVGIVADSRNTSLKTRPPRMVYLHYADQKLLFTIAFVARGSQHAGALLAGMRTAIWNYAPDVTISRLKTLDSQVSDSVAAERFQTSIIAAFGVSALLLAMLGIYGVLSYSTAMRKQEIGVRIALGATRGGVYALALTGAAVPVAIGVAGGLIAYALAGRVIRGLIQGVETVDSWMMLLVFAVLLTAAGAAAFLPARRAASLDAMEALRSD